MSKDRHEILDAALKVFIRYGFRRTTMGDLAEEAGMSRPALYQQFPNKEAIFRAVAVDFLARAVEEVETDIDGHESVAAKLVFILNVWIVRPFELIHSAPDARELMDCTHDFLSDVIEDGYRAMESSVAGSLETSSEALALHSLTPGAVAQVLTASAIGFKDYARDVDELRVLIEGLVKMTVAVTGSQPFAGNCKE
ncbi:TetR/AcrR family transcriptional regulator [Granulosicoccus sp. 3-233]|uniref:TetR/AcrR family transcriptional regulator n=1 Tax=Granulosicoccus sp. 3-233 TaxID=3417969 RepID=UPI003D32AE1B